MNHLQLITVVDYLRSWRRKGRGVGEGEKRRRRLEVHLTGTNNARVLRVIDTSNIGNIR